MIKSLLREYGFMWLVYRSLYLVKLKMMRALPITEKLFEKKVSIKKIDIVDINSQKIESFLTKLSDHKKKEIIEIADNAIEGKIRAFSCMDLSYGNPINWHYNPITKAEIDKNRKWYKIADFDSDIGDIKVLWEASRFTHFYYIVRAYLLTHDLKYYNAFSNQLDKWIKDNKYSFGVNYKCGQEATIRMINALIVYSVFKSCNITNKKDEVNIKKLIEDSYKKVQSNFFYAHKCIKNNHTLSEITGLIVGAWCSEDEVKLNKAYKLLNKEIRIQFLLDGGYKQYSFNYQRLALQLMEFMLMISNKTKKTLSDYSKQLIKKSTLLLYQMQYHNGDVPNYGSNDGALIFDVTCCDYRDFRPVLNTIFLLLEGKRLYGKGDYDEEILWFAENKFDKIKYANIKKHSIGYKKSGFYCLRNNSNFLMILLQDFKTRPAQMDQLHIDLWYKGENILCDSGTYSYAINNGKDMVLTEAHNTIKIDNKDQMKKNGKFLIYDWVKVKDIEFTKKSFKGTMISKNGYSHTRSIEMTKYGYLIEDTVKADGNACICNFHTPCKVRILSDGFELIDDGSVIAKINTSEKIKIIKSQRSLYYLKLDEINQISINKKISNNYCEVKFEIKLL